MGGEQAHPAGNFFFTLFAIFTVFFVHAQHAQFFFFQLLEYPDHPLRIDPRRQHHFHAFLIRLGLHAPVKIKGLQFSRHFQDERQSGVGIPQHRRQHNGDGHLPDDTACGMLEQHVLILVRQHARQLFRRL